MKPSDGVDLLRFATIIVLVTGAKLYNRSRDDLAIQSYFPAPKVTTKKKVARVAEEAGPLDRRFWGRF